MKIINYRSVEKGFLKGFFDVVIEQWGMTISCSWFAKNDSKWVGLPQREYEKGGEKKYQPLVRMTEEAKKRFDAKCIELIEKGEYTVQESQQPAPKFAQGNMEKGKGASQYDDDCPF